MQSITWGITNEATYHPAPGENVTESCRNAAQMAQAQKRNISFVFNGVMVVATPRTKPESLYRKWDAGFKKMQETWRKSPAGVLQERERKARNERNQAAIHDLLADLPGYVKNLDGLIVWLKEYTQLADWIGVNCFPSLVLQQLEAAGYSVGENVGNPPEWFNTRERLGRYIIGQAMDYLSRGHGPHPVTMSFCEKYFALPETDGAE